MDFNWFVSTFDDTITLTKQLTKLDLALLASALSFIESEDIWTSGNYDDIEAKLADIHAILDDD